MDKIRLVKVIMEGLVNIVNAIRCRSTCCKSSCNTDTDNGVQKNV